MTWILFPLYGLNLVEGDAWLADPLFGDATLVSRAALRSHLGADDHPLLRHGKLLDTLGSDALATVGLPLAQLVEIEPLAYVAVRDVGDESKNIRRSTEIRALLSATLVLRAGRLQTVASSPAEIAWYVAPGKVVLQPGKPVATDIAPQFNEHVLLTPLQVSQKAIRASLEDGAVIPNANGWSWDMHREHAVCQLFLGKSKKFERRLLDCAVQIQEAGCATSYATQLQMAVASMEVLLQPKSFSDLERILKAFFCGEDQERAITEILRARHRITHEGAGRGDTEGRIKESAHHALVFSWLMLDAVTAFGRANTGITFDEYVAMLTSAIELDRKSARLPAGAPDAHQKLLHKSFSAFAGHMTANVKFGEVGS